MSESVEKRSSPREEKIPERIPEIVKGRLLAEIWKVLKQDKTAFCGFFVILGLVALAVLAPWIAPYDFSEQHIVHSFMGPSGRFWRWALERLVHGALLWLSRRSAQCSIDAWPVSCTCARIVDSADARSH